ncbi:MULTISPECIES: SDR family NAD(P)-dependent oxidoreductase [unclassified Nocardioides]|uniref:SDR family NAD(P)-dependent oxidoreductase n=1 Tax=unclassified Nocardioides TaxID=2615069 RepID=UPI00360928B7
MQTRGNVFAVTGGGNGIGREVVLALLRDGARVAAIDLRGDSLAETAALAGAGERLSSHVVDITDRAAVEALPAAVVEAHGRVDGLVNVAGIIQKFVPFADLPYEEIERVLSVNLWGVLHTSKAFLPHLLDRPAACLVNVSSMGGLAPVPGQTIYGASKAAVKLFTEGLYAELLGSRVAVTTVFPGGVGTGIADNSGAAVPGMDESSDLAANLTAPDDAARQIVEGIEKGSYRVVIGRDARMVDRMTRLAPRRATELIAKRMAGLLS